MKKTIHLVTIISFLIVTPFAGAQTQDDLKHLTYPELEVTPRASERLELEMKREEKRRWTRHWPIQASALTVLLAASSAESDNPSNRHKRSNIDEGKSIANMIGGSWLAGTLLLSAIYQPYNKGYKQISGMPGKTKREQLTRERLAEESLYAPGRLGWKLQWFSTLTEVFAASPFIADGDDDTKTLGIIAAATAFLPLVFESDWSRVADQHREYKKKIYGPVAGPVLLLEDQSYRLGYGLTYAF